MLFWKQRMKKFFCFPSGLFPLRDATWPRFFNPPPPSLFSSFPLIIRISRTGCVVGGGAVNRMNRPAQKRTVRKIFTSRIPLAYSLSLLSHPYCSYTLERPFLISFYYFFWKDVTTVRICIIMQIAKLVKHCSRVGGKGRGVVLPPLV